MKFDFHNPYPTARLPVFARNVVSTSHPLAAQAGLRMLWKGGNAVDAAIAAAAAMTDLRAGEQRPGQRRLRDPVGRQGAAWPQCLGPRARRVDARVLQAQVRSRRQDAAQARHRLRDGAGRRGRLGGAERALRQAAFRRPDGAGHRDRRARLPVARRGATEMGGGHAGAAASMPGFARGLPAVGPRAQGRRAVPVPGGGARPARHRAEQGRGLLRRRDRAGHREIRGGQRRRHHGPGLRRLQARMGQAHRQELPRPHAARDSAQRPGHRRADRAGHPGEVRPGRACRWTARIRSTCRSKR